jgi:hypothetical protein
VHKKGVFSPSQSPWEKAQTLLWSDSVFGNDRFKLVVTTAWSAISSDTEALADSMSVMLTSSR